MALMCASVENRPSPCTLLFQAQADPSPLSVPLVLLSQASKANEARRQILNRRGITKNKQCGRLSESNHLCRDPRKQVGGNLHRLGDTRCRSESGDGHHQMLLAIVTRHLPQNASARPRAGAIVFCDTCTRKLRLRPVCRQSATAKSQYNSDHSPQNSRRV